MEHCYVLSETDFEPVTAPQVMAEYLNKQMSDLLNTADTTLARYEDKVKDAESFLSRKEPPPTLPPPPPPASPTALQPTPGSATPAIFRPNPDLKPSMLEKECSYQECVHFTELWTSYIIAGYGSEGNIPQETLYIQLQPFINASWLAQLLEMGIKEKTFKEIPGVIKAVASRFITLFDRSLDFLKTKRGNMAHSDFLLLLEKLIRLVL